LAFLTESRQSCFAPIKNSHQKKNKAIHLNLNSASGLPEGCEVTLEVVQAMTRDLRQQTLNLQEERERLVSARRELGKLQRELPRREKKTNTQVRESSVM
jgi:hypothetical protein